MRVGNVRPQAHLSSAESGAAWAARLGAAAVAEAAGAALCRSRTERDKLQSCAAGLGAAADAFRAALAAARAALLHALAPRLAAWAELLAAPADHPGDDP